MVYTTPTQVQLLSNISTSDVSSANQTSIIAEATKELNRFINVVS